MSEQSVVRKPRVRSDFVLALLVSLAMGIPMRIDQARDWKIENAPHYEFVTNNPKQAMGWRIKPNLQRVKKCVGYDEHEDPHQLGLSATIYVRHNILLVRCE